MNKKTGKDADTTFTKNDWDSLSFDLKHFGYLLPTSDSELESFNKVFGSHLLPIPEHLKSGDFLFAKRVKTLTINSTVHKPTPIKSPPVVIKKGSRDYFKKIVLAAEIAYQLHDEPTFGHKKFVKLQYLCEQVCNMQLSTRYNKYAAGPLDPKLMHSIDSEFEKQKWFRVTKRDSFGFKYEALEGVEKYKKYFLTYFGNQAKEIDFLLGLFRKEKSDFCEAVATLYFIWKEYSAESVMVNETSLIKGFYQWDEQKKRFSESILKETISWMIANGIVPQKLI